MFWAIVIGAISAFLALVGLQLWFGKESDAGLKKFGMWFAMFFGAILVGIFGWYKISYSAPENVARRAAEGLDRRCSDASMAYVMSQNFVKRHLKAPSTAAFPSGVARYSQAIGNCQFAVNSYVDSQNSFGAMVRSSYTATMEYIPKDDTWRTVALDIQ